MRSSQLSALDEMIVKMRAGRMRRRAFLERAMALGLTGGVAGSLLAACGGSGDSSGGNGAALNIVWRSEDEPTGVYQKLVDQYNQTNKDGIHITLMNSHIDSARLLTIFLNMLSVRSADSDIISMDIIWPAQFALNQWIVPIDKMWPTSERKNYLPGPIQGCTLGGQIWAAPLRTDAGLLFYRKDLVTTPPDTWDELATTAGQVQASGKTKYGYVWQGAQNEGMVCVFAEVLYGFGGTVLDPQNPRRVTINSPEAVNALTAMVGWVKSISPTSPNLATQGSVVSSWNNGDAVFMRNWPVAYSLANVPASKVAGKYGIHSIPYGGLNTGGHSVVGGWQLAINAFSNTDKINAAWKFIHYMLGADAQKALAQASILSTLKTTYQEKEVLAKVPFFQQLGPILQTALPRPVSPRYADLTRAIQARVYQALTQKSTPREALAALEGDLQLIVTL